MHFAIFFLGGGGRAGQVQKLSKGRLCCRLNSISGQIKSPTYIVCFFISLFLVFIVTNNYIDKEMRNQTRLKSFWLENNNNNIIIIQTYPSSYFHTADILLLYPIYIIILRTRISNKTYRVIQWIYVIYPIIIIYTSTVVLELLNHCQNVIKTSFLA